MTFYQELQLNQAGSKNLLKKSETLKEKLYHMWVYLVKIAATMAFCFFFVSILDVYKRQGHCFAQTAFCPATGFIKIHIVVHSSTHRASYIFFSHSIASQKHRINTFPVPN